MGGLCRRVLRHGAGIPVCRWFALAVVVLGGGQTGAPCLRCRRSGTLPARSGRGNAGRGNRTYIYYSELLTRSRPYSTFERLLVVFRWSSGCFPAVVVLFWEFDVREAGVFRCLGLMA